MTTFYLVRHALKSVAGEVLTGRTPGVHLSDEGRRQAERLARRLAPAPIRKIYSSPLERARETALPLAQRRGLDVEISEAIGEMDFGAWTSKTPEELASDARWMPFNVFRSGARIPGGDLMLEVQTRFVAEMVRLREAFPEDHVALFSHGDPIRAAVAFFAGVPLDLFQRLEISPASVSILSLGDYGPKIHLVNETLPR